MFLEEALFNVLMTKGDELLSDVRVTSGRNDKGTKK